MSRFVGNATAGEKGFSARILSFGEAELK